MLEVQIKKKLGDFALDLNLKLGNEFTVLLGESGNGKSLTLSAIAGFLQPDFGYIKLDEKFLHCQKQNIFLPPEKRNIGYVMQDSYLFPHLNVQKNLLFGVKNLDEDLLKSLLEILDLQPLLTRGTHNLSGGEKQRVSIARALLTKPKLLLMDEPISAIDPRQKDKILVYLKKIHNAIKIPILYVTHSISEAEFLAENIAIIKAGKIVKCDKKEKITSSDDIFKLGKTFVNFLKGALLAQDPKKDFSVIQVAQKQIHIPFFPAEVGTQIYLSLPADQILLSKSNLSDIGSVNVFRAKVKKFVRKSSTKKIFLLDCGFDLAVELPQDDLNDISHISIGDEVKIVFRREAIEVF